MVELRKLKPMHPSMTFDGIYAVESLYYGGPMYFYRSGKIAIALDGWAYVTDIETAEELTSRLSQPWKKEMEGIVGDVRDFRRMGCEWN